MISASRRLLLWKKAKEQFKSIYDSLKNCVTIHYSCESFYNRPDGSSARITSIAVRNIENGQTLSFSIHQMAERKKVNLKELENRYDELEKLMLEEFYNYISKDSNNIWLHWNMRDINYGFPALAHRYKVLGGKPVDIHESQLFDLSKLLNTLYGDGYCGHPRLKNLIEKNGISHRDFLSGEQEAESFNRKEYVKLHLSTLRKVYILANIVDKLANGSLKTDASIKEIYGNHFLYLIEILRENWVVILLGILGSFASIIGLILWFTN